MRVYLASGFFNLKQVSLVETIEGMARKAGIDLYSPRRDGPGILASMSQDERDEKGMEIFSTNCIEIVASDAVLAVIDDRDTGVVFEMGFAYGRSVPIVSFSNENYGMNVMMKGAISHHLLGLAELEKFFDHIIRCDTIYGLEGDSSVHPVVT
jgi:nucleoside 2-deoxyribosyltransferase